MVNYSNGGTEDRAPDKGQRSFLHNALDLKFHRSTTRPLHSSPP
jgi:hypothetical protein